jgi:hypothetical protein
VRPFSQLSRTALADAPALLSDVDGTLTTGGILRGSTVAAIEKLAATGLPVFLVTGRPAAYAQALARYLPIRGAIAENGGLWYLRDPATGMLSRHLPCSEQQFQTERRQLEAIVARVLQKFPLARLSSDSRYTEADLAIDHSEEAHLPRDQIDALELALKAEGLQAVRSSVHINVWAGAFDKAHTSLRVLHEVLGLESNQAMARCLYLGDAPNDAPMFAEFARSVGVANIKDHLEHVPSLPGFITRAREGTGACEVLKATAAARLARKAARKSRKPRA